MQQLINTHLGDVWYCHLSRSWLWTRNGKPIVRQTKTGLRISYKHLEPIKDATPIGSRCLDPRHRRVQTAISKIRLANIVVTCAADGDAIAVLLDRALHLAKIDTMGCDRYRYEVARSMRRAGMVPIALVLERDKDEGSWRDVFEMANAQGHSTLTGITSHEVYAAVHMLLALAEYCKIAMTDEKETDHNACN